MICDITNITYHAVTVDSIKILDNFKLKQATCSSFCSGCVEWNVDDISPEIRFFLRQLYTILEPEAEYNGAQSVRGEIVILSSFSGETVRRCGRNKEWTGLQPLCRGKERRTSSLYWHWQETSSGYWPAPHQSNTSWLQWELFAIFF